MRNSWVTLFIALLPIACRAEAGPVALERVELPVVSIALPPGDVDDAQAKSPNSGRLVIMNAAGRGGVLILGWDTGEAFTDDDVAMLGRALTQEAGRATPGPGRTVAGVEARTLLMDLGKSAPVRMTVWSCGDHNVYLGTYFRGEDAASLTDRILDTAVCREATPSAPLVPRLTLPAGWARLPSDEDVTFTSVAGGLVVIKESPAVGGGSESREKKTRVLMRAFLEASGTSPKADDIQITRFDADGDERFLGRADTTVEELPLTLQAVLVSCPSLGTDFSVAATSLGGSPDGGVPDAFFHARCPERRDAPGPAYPEAVPYFERACADGDAASCSRLADVSEDTDYPALLDPARVERARKRACELGGPDYCP